MDLGTLMRKAWYAELIIGYVSFDVLPYAWLWHDISFWKCASARSAIIDSRPFSFTSQKQYSRHEFYTMMLVGRSISILNEAQT